MVLCGSRSPESSSWEYLLCPSNSGGGEIGRIQGDVAKNEKLLGKRNRGIPSACSDEKGAPMSAQVKDLGRKVERDDEEGDHEVHIWTERERRKKMRDMFSALHSLLPQLPPKADKTSIVDTAVDYIKTLEDQLLELEKLREDKLQREQPTIHKEICLREVGLCTDRPTPYFPLEFETWTSPNMVLSILGHEAQITICTHRKPGLFTSVCSLLQEYKMDLVSAHLSSENSRGLRMIQLQVRRCLQRSDNVFFAVKEVFKHVAENIILLLSS